ncbi:MAG: DUF2520 domain-containing protein [Bacteroidales bacterium]
MAGISFIGSGNVATVLGRLFLSAGVPVEGVWSHNPDHAAHLAKKLNCSVFKEISDIPPAGMPLIISVRDEAIVRVVSELQHVNRIVVHTSGSVPLSALKGCGGPTGVLYPLQTLSANLQEIPVQIPFCIEASDMQTLLKIRELASKISEKIYEVNSEQRRWLHLAAVVACNFPNLMYDIAMRIAGQAGLQAELLRPLITETARKVQQASADKVQTGPAMRRDTAVMERHLQLLENSPEWQKIYRVLSDEIIRLHHGNNSTSKE